MSWLFSQVLVEEYLGENSLDGEQSVQSSGSHTQQAYCAPDRMTAFSRLSRFGMMYKPLTENLGRELLMLYLEDFHAKTLVPQEKAQELMENDQECGEKWRASFVKYDPDSSLWRTHQCSLLGDLDEFLETWPQWGLMRDGECWEQQTLAQTIRGTESGLSAKFPTPTVGMVTGGQNPEKGGQVGLGYMARKNKWPTPDANCGQRGTQPEWTSQRPSGHPAQYSINQAVRDAEQNNGGPLNPMWVEWLMGWPLGWTDLKPLEMDKSHFVPQQHGES